MKTIRTKAYPWLILALLGLGFAQPVFSASLAVSPTAVNYRLGSNAAINLTWTVTTTGNGGGGSTSTSGTFTSAPTTNAPIGTGNGLLSMTNPATGTNSVSETVYIPPTVLNTVQTQSLSTIYYYRSFNNIAEGDTGVEFVQINILPALTPTPTTNIQSVLALERVALRFNDDSIVKLVRPKTVLSSVAEITYTGTGLLDAIWEVATPASTLGGQSAERLIYTPLRSVRQYLGVGGRIYLQSPPLPTETQGNYVLRLQIRQPAASQTRDARASSYTQPILRYSVSQGGETAGPRKMMQVKLREPADNVLLTGDTRFRWQPVRGARAYQLELYLPPEKHGPASELDGDTYDETSIAKQQPASGVLVPGKKTSLSIGALSRQHLHHGETYLWRIVAIGNNGRILTSSPVRKIRIP